MALMTLPLMLSLLCDENRFFREKRIAGMSYFHKLTERETSQLADYFAIFCCLRCND